MPLTRAQTDAFLIGRCRGLLEFAGMNFETVGSNPDINGSIADALFGMGIVPADPLNVVDSDLAPIEAVDELLDRAEYRLLRDIAGNLTAVDVTVGPRHESLSQIAANLDKQIERMEKHLIQSYGIGTGTLSAGSIELDFQSTTEPIGDDEWT